MSDSGVDVSAVENLPTHDLNLFLHELNGRAIRQMPAGARTVLSAGSLEGWHFGWFAQHYPCPVARHLGLGPYHATPAALPPQAAWLVNAPGKMDGVGTGEVDLVYGHQAAERLWPEEVTALLTEASRVLRAGGWLVLAGANRRTADALGWSHPEHTVAYTVPEAVELLEAAGFDEVRVRGVWLCYDREAHRYLPLDPGAGGPGWDYKRRVALAADRPEDSLVWWAEARRGDRRPDHPRLLERCQAIHHAVWPGIVARASHLVGRLEGTGRNRLVFTAAGEAGYAKYGPHIPLRPGRYQATFAVGCPADVAGVAPGEIVCELDVCCRGGRKTLARCQLAYGELATGRLSEVVLPFQLYETESAVESRILATGRAPLFARFQSELGERTPETERVSTPPGQERWTASDLIWKELDLLQVRYNMLGTLIAQLNGK
jgi:hypothetical protein